MGTAIVVVCVALALLGIAGIMKKHSPFNPMFLATASSVLLLQVTLLGFHQVRFHHADVEVIVAARTIPPGTELAEADLRTTTIDRADAEGAIRSLDDAVRRVTVSQLATGKPVTDAVAASFVSLPLSHDDVAGGAIQQGKRLAKTATVRVDVFAAPEKTPDKPVIIEGALLDQKGGRLTLRLTKTDRTTLLAIMARSTITIEPSED